MAKANHEIVFLIVKLLFLGKGYALILLQKNIKNDEADKQLGKWLIILKRCDQLKFWNSNIHLFFGKKVFHSIGAKHFTHIAIEVAG